MRRGLGRWSVATGLVAVVVAGCAGGVGEPRPGASPTAAHGGVTVVATTSILGDLVRNVLGDAGTVDVVIDAGTDPHAFEASASDIAAVREADLVVANGLGLETNLVDVLEAAEQEGVEVLRVAEYVDPLPFEEADGHGDDAGHDHGSDDHEDDGGATETGGDAHGHGELDPHFWLDPQRVEVAVDVIAGAAADAAPEVTSTVRSNARAYRDEVVALDAELEEVFGAIPEERRVLVTNHDAFGYLAERYGFEVIGTVIPGGSTLAEPSARELAELAAVIEEADVPAIFTENVASARVVETVRREVGREVDIVRLYSDALGDAGSGAATYLDLMRTNAERIADALTR